MGTHTIPLARVRARGDSLVMLRECYTGNSAMKAPGDGLYPQILVRGCRLGNNDCLHELYLDVL